MNRANVQNVPGWRRSFDEVAQITPQVADFGHGDRLLVPASGLALATIGKERSPIIAIIVHPNDLPISVLDTLSVEGCRSLANRMIELCDSIEAQASEAAAAALRKAAGK